MGKDKSPCPCDECDRHYVSCEKHCEKLALWDENHPGHELAMFFEKANRQQDALEAGQQAIIDKHRTLEAEKEKKLREHLSRKERQRENYRRYWAAHKEEINAKNRAYRAKLKQQSEGHSVNAEERKRLRKERLKEYRKKWMATHRDKAREYCRNYYERHWEELKAKSLQRYYAKHEEELKVRALRRYYKRKEAEQNELARLVYAGTGTADTGVIQLGIPDCCGGCQQVTG